MKQLNENYIIDKMNDEIAALEKDGVITEIEISKLPAGTKEGDVIIFDGAEYIIDSEATEKRRKELFQKQQILFKRKQSKSRPKWSAF